MMNKLKPTKYTSDSPYTIEELTKMDIEAGKAPRFLYKFRGNNENTKKIITNQALFHPSPVNFNDPFDCQLQLETTSSRKEIEEFIRRNNPQMKSNDIKAQTLKWANNPELLHQVINNGANESFSKHGICCYAQDATNLLMWSHYGDSHKGLCLKFDVLADIDAFSPLFEVKYSDDYPQINHIKAPEGASVTSLLTTKAKDWEYEKEWRVLKFGDCGNHPFAKESLKEVIFGCRTSADFVREIKALVKSAGMHHTIFKRAHKIPHQFALDFHPV